MRANVEIDDALLHEARRLTGMATKRETVDHALRFAELLQSLRDDAEATLDRLIAARCVRANAPLLHADKDFDRLASCTPLRIYGATRP